MEEPFSFEAAVDTTAGAWVIANLQGFAESVLSIVPAGFAAYARIFHPAYKLSGHTITTVEWTKVAEINGKCPHRQMQWPNISGENARDSNEPSSSKIWSEEPLTGTLPVELSEALCQTLTQFTETPKLCWFAVWEGFGYLRPEARSAPILEIPDRNMYLFKAPIEAITASFSTQPWVQSANLWWPDDRSWCVATEIDLMTTYVAGTYEAIEAITKLLRLESHKVEPSDGVQYKSDTINSDPGKG